MGRRGEQWSDFERSEKSGVARDFEGRGYIGGNAPYMVSFLSTFLFHKRKVDNKKYIKEKI
jgi:hypothetical protein